MRIVLDILAGLAWLGGVALFVVGLLDNILRGGFYMQGSCACFLCAIFLTLYVDREKP